MKKKILSIFCVLLVLMLCFAPLTCFAAEATEAEGGVTEDTDMTPTPDAPENTEDEEYHTIFTRVWEYVVENKTELLGILGDGIILVLAFLVKMGADKKNKRIADAVAEVQKTTGLNLSNQQDVVTVVNGMIESYNKLEAEYKAFKETYDKYGQTEIDRNKVIGALAAEVNAVLEILTTVYANSKNLPQGVKDLISIKYANVLKALESDEELASVVKAVRILAGASDNTTAVEDTTEDTED